MLFKLQSVLPKIFSLHLFSLRIPFFLCILSNLYTLLYTTGFDVIITWYNLTKIFMQCFAGEGSDDNAFSKTSYIYSKSPRISWSCSCWGGHNFGHLSYHQEIVPPTSCKYFGSGKLSVRCGRLKFVAGNNS